jgi:hypothetical protein
MAHEPHKQSAHTTTPTPQHLVLRALVGSLVFCATLSAAHVPARACSQYANIALARSSAVFKAHAHASRAAGARGANVSRAHANQLDAISAPPTNDMIASASGKQLSHEPGMSRAQAGNLIRQNLSLP